MKKNEFPAFNNHKVANDDSNDNDYDQTKQRAERHIKAKKKGKAKTFFMKKLKSQRLNEKQSQRNLPA